MPELLETLRRENCSLIVLRDSDSLNTAIRRYGRGVRDLYELSRDADRPLHGAIVADKVVGRGAAALMACAGVREVYALTISRPALQLLEQQGIPVQYINLTDGIRNRADDGPCPVESLCAAPLTPQQCLPLIEKFLNENVKQ